MTTNRRIRLLVLLTIAILTVGFFVIRPNGGASLYKDFQASNALSQEEEFDRWRAQHQGNIENQPVPTSAINDETKNLNAVEDTNEQKEAKTKQDDRHTNGENVVDYSGPQAPPKPHNYKVEKDPESDVEEPKSKSKDGDQGPPVPATQNISPPAKGSENGPDQPKIPTGAENDNSQQQKIPEGQVPKEPVPKVPTTPKSPSEGSNPKQPIKQDAKGQDAKGQDAKGQDAKGQDAKGQDAKAPDTKAPDAKAPDTKAQGQNSVPGKPPVLSDLLNEPADPKNPGGFLGGTMEVDRSETSLNGNIYEEETDEEALKKFEKSKIGDVEHDNEVTMVQNNRKKIGVPDAKMKPQQVTKPVKPLVQLNDNFQNLNIVPLNFRIYSHNVKNGGHNDLVPGEEIWEERFRKITNSIKFHSQYNTIVTLQEVYKFQMDDIMNELNKFSTKENPEWSYFGEGRIDGENVGEFVPILFKNSDWELIQSDTFWLNEKNEKVSVEGWDAKYLRIASFVTLKHKLTNNYINVFNSHFDHIGELSRIGSSGLILRKMNSINKWPSFLCGDLNLERREKSYILLSQFLTDTQNHITPFNNYGHSDSSVTGFEGEVLSGGGQNIDYIFAPKYTSKISDPVECETGKETSSDAKDKLYLRLDGFGMLHSKFKGTYMSDHRPIVADFHLEGKCKSVAGETP